MAIKCEPLAASHPCEQEEKYSGLDGRGKETWVLVGSGADLLLSRKSRLLASSPLAGIWFSV